jgi:hypothetical protein
MENQRTCNENQINYLQLNTKYKISEESNKRFYVSTFNSLIKPIMYELAMKLSSKGCLVNYINENLLYHPIELEYQLQLNDINLTSHRVLFFSHKNDEILMRISMERLPEKYLYSKIKIGELSLELIEKEIITTLENFSIITSQANNFCTE